MKIVYSTLAAAAVALCLQGCTDWDDHYAPGAEGGASASLWENISAREDLSDFASILKKTGYSEVLSTDQTFTVWAPVNSALDDKMDSLNNVQDSLLLMEFVKNHVARNNYGASGAVDKQVRMVNGKVLDFAGSGENYTFSGVPLQDINQIGKNGVFYTAKSLIPFHANLYEYLDKGDGLDSIAKYYHRYDKTVLDKTASVAGPVVNGEVTYLDEVYNKTNTLYDNLDAYINAEDSSYSMLLPTNTAWVKAKDDISKYFHYAPKYYYEQLRTVSSDTTIIADKIPTDSLNKLYTEQALVSNLVYSNNTYANGILQTAQSGIDSLVSTTRSVMRGSDADALFAGTRRVNMSNGYGFVTNELNFKPWRAWAPLIRLQGENVGYLGKVTGESSSTRVSVNSSNRNPKVEGSLSGNAFYEVITATKRSTPEVYYYLPNVLSTTYNLYGVFVPNNMVDTTATVEDYTVRATVRFYMSGTTVSQTVGASSKVSFQVGDQPLTDVAKVDTVYLGEFKFDNAYMGLGDQNIYPTLKIAGSRGKNLNIDCFLLVPKELDDYRKAHPGYRWDD